MASQEREKDPLEFAIGVAFWSIAAWPVCLIVSAMAMGAPGDLVWSERWAIRLLTFYPVLILLGWRMFRHGKRRKFAWLEAVGVLCCYLPLLIWTVLVQVTRV